MGHTITAELPKTQKWDRVLSLMQAPVVDHAAITSATVDAAERRLLALRGDPSLTYSFWLLTRLAAASRGDEFQDDLIRLGIEVNEGEHVLSLLSRINDGEHVLSLLARINDRVTDELAQFPESGPFSDISSLAVRRALTDTLGAQNLSLFGSTVDDLAGAFRTHSSAAQFGELATRFFGDFYARTLRYYIDRAIPASLTADGGLQSIGDAQVFSAALDRHARESARIVERFASEWFVKHHGLHGGPISREEVERFTAHALRKLRKELLVDAS